MSTEIVTTNGHDGGAVLEAVIAAGDLAKLTPAQRVEWYRIRCDAAGLDPRTQPFQYITLQGKLTLYATKTATEQLCARRSITTAIVGRDRADDLYIVTCRASADGRYTESIGAVSIAGLRGDALANALMKAETKAKRRAVLSLSGLGMLDETEVATIPGAGALVVDGETGEVLDVPALPAPAQTRQEPPPATNGHATPATPTTGKARKPAPASAPPGLVATLPDDDADVVKLVRRIDAITDEDHYATARTFVASLAPELALAPAVLAALDRARAELDAAAMDWAGPADGGADDDDPDGLDLDGAEAVGEAVAQ